MATSTGTITSAAGPLDVQTLVNNLMGAEKQALTPLTKQATSYNSLISAYGNLKSAITTYQSAINALTAASFSAQKSTVTNKGTGTNLTTDPFTGSVNTDTSTKALAQTLQSAGFPGSQMFSAGDSLAIKIGNNPPTFVTLANNTNLAGVRDAINAKKTGATASIVTDGSGDHLVLQSNSAGTANTLKIQANNSLSSLAYDPTNPSASTMKQTQAPRDTTAAASGNYTIGVSQLAQAQKITSTGFALGATFNTGILAIKTGTGSTTLINPTTNTLAGVRDAINSSSAGVNASIVSDGTLAHLVITAKESGASNSVTITGTGDYSPFTFSPSGVFTSPSVPGAPSPQSFDVSSGGISIKVGDTSTNIPLTGATASLLNVRDAINTAAIGVTASITNDGSKDRLVLTPTGSNSTNPVALTGTGDFSVLSGSNMGQLQVAQDAKLSIDGVAVSSPTNTITNAISGVTLNVTKVTTSADNFTMSISNDTSGVSTAANSFVSAFNALEKAITTLTQQTPAKTPGQTGTSSPLASESSVQNMMSQIRSALLAPVQGGNGISSLTDIGIGFQKDGTLALNAAKLVTATNNNFNGVANLFTSTGGTNTDGTLNTTGTNGVVVQLQSLLKGFLADGGIIDNKTKGVQASLKVNTDRQTAMQMRLTNMQDQYTRQFNALNVTLSNMQATQNRLTSDLAKLSKSN